MVTFWSNCSRKCYLNGSRSRYAMSRSHDKRSGSWKRCCIMNYSYKWYAIKFCTLCAVDLPKKDVCKTQNERDFKLSLSLLMPTSFYILFFFFFFWCFQK
ncbi:hypothetical protein EUGRSUZ_F01451 [Eucalyptus grandis]|uniref:Uncharacterized protein n=2 Tax=Eucalyptus grandis TaxID=71139 RepID=A0A059BNA4_EUCGR|nr:hypothetical protein EUGRSUZ_F01451 [Eucalyptus grandis]